MKNGTEIKDLLGQLDESTLKEFLASINKERTKEKSGSSWKDWYPELFRKCANKKPRKRRLALNHNNNH